MTMTEATATATAKQPKRVSEIDKGIGTRVRALRMSKGMSQEKLGEKLGLTFQQVQKYEKGVNRLSGSRMAQVCQILGCTPSFLVNGEDDGQAEHAGSIPPELFELMALAGAKVEAHIHALCVMESKERDLVFQLAAALASKQ